MFKALHGIAALLLVALMVAVIGCGGTEPTKKVTGETKKTESKM
jgi:uncharacterized lipoprotein YehR (DUF1307 family)